MSERIEPGAYRSDAQFTIKPTTQEAVEHTRRAVQKRALDDAEHIRFLAELGIEGTDD